MELSSLKSTRVLTQSCPLFATPWTVAGQAPLSTGFSRQEYWSGLPFPIPGDRPNLGIEPASSVSPALARWILYQRATWEAPLQRINTQNSRRHLTSRGPSWAPLFCSSICSGAAINFMLSPPLPHLSSGPTKAATVWLNGTGYLL